MTAIESGVCAVAPGEMLCLLLLLRVAFVTLGLVSVCIGLTEFLRDLLVAMGMYFLIY